MLVSGSEDVLCITLPPVLRESFVCRVLGVIALLVHKHVDDQSAALSLKHYLFSRPIPEI